jgi:transcriptional regulator
MLYRPSSFACDDRETLLAFIRANPFATVINPGKDNPWVAHLPLIYENGQLFGHMARANPLVHAFGSADVQVIFHGPHAYVSPTWYAKAPAVPTWNYAVVHALGPARLLNDDETTQVVDRMAELFEPDGTWRFSGLPENYRTDMLRGIVGLSIAVLRIEGKFKLSQNRDETDRRLVAERLSQGSPTDRDVARLMLSPQPAEP